jgi:hypothetical protein
MTPRLIWFARITLALTAMGLSLRGGFDLWLEGAVFGLAVAVWAVPRRPALLSLQTLVFVVCSGLIYELVFRVGLWFITHTRAFDRVLLGPATPGVFLGIVLLAVAQARLLGARWQRVAVGVPGIALVCVTAILVVPRFAHFNMGMLAAVWQLAYLAFFATYGRLAPEDSPPTPVAA